MSQSTPICRLFCSRCKRADMRKPGHYDRDHVRNYLDVIVIGLRSNGGATLLCRKCGHRYNSNSAAARRAARRMANAEPQPRREAP